MNTSLHIGRKVAGAIQSLSETFAAGRLNFAIDSQAKSPDTATFAQQAAMNPQGMSYVGELDVLSLTSGTVTDSSAVLSSYEIEVTATQNGKEVSRSTTQVMVLPDLHELMKPRAQSDSLKRLALATGGTTLHGPDELARQVLIWGLPVDPISADGAAKLRSRAAPLARIEPQILFMKDH